MPPVRVVGPCADTAWTEVSGRLSAIVADLDAVVRAHVGGPVLRFEDLSRGTARLIVGRARFRLSLEPWRGEDLVALAFPRAVFVLTACDECGDRSRARLVLWLDPIDRRWTAPDDPFTPRSLDDRHALEAALFAVLADACACEPEASSPPGSRSGASSAFAGGATR